MRRVLKAVSVGAMLAAVGATPLVAAALKAGVGQIEITPPLGLSMYGYGSRKAGATGVLDPLDARVLVLEAGETRLALVNLDLGRVFAKAWIDRLRADARNNLGISYVLVTATHTHSGPAIRDEFPSKASGEWETQTLEKVERALEAASQHTLEARMGAGYGIAYLGHNRLRVNPDGTVTWFERNPAKVPTAPVDPTVTVLRVDGADGRPLALLVNYACHAVVFGPDNLQYSADYPGVMMASVRRAFSSERVPGPPPAGSGEAAPQGGPPLVMFLQGGDGDINPYYAVTPLEQDAVKMRDWTGETLAREVVRVAKNIRTTALPQASLEYREDTLDFHLRWDPVKFREAVLKSWGAEAAEAFDRQLKEGLHLPVGVVLIDKRFAMMSMPGEPFVDFQEEWRRQCPVEYCLFLGYANGNFGYFPTLKAATLGGYGAANTATYVEVGAGEAMLDHARVQLDEILGKLTDMPEDLKKQ